jgi:prepilin-type N-terminal cleavage/methylation domain-containing protein
MAGGVLMKKGFTLIELMVVISMIAVLIGAVASSTTNARARARIVKATADVKEITNAILAYENYSVGGQHRIPERSDENASESSLGFILGKGPSADGGTPVPVLYNASLSPDGTIRDPWNTPYRIRIVEVSQDDVDSVVGKSSFRTGFALPNFYRLKEEERP